MADFTKGEQWERYNAPNGGHIWCGDMHIADIITDTNNPHFAESVNEITKSAVLMHNNPKYRAAPDMYEACLIGLGVIATLDQSKGWVKSASNTIQKALAKAEGQA